MHLPGGAQGGSGPTFVPGRTPNHASSPAKNPTSSNTTSFLPMDTHLLTGTAALAACVTVWAYAPARTALCAFLTLASSLFLLTLFRPDLWTPELFVASESTLALGAVLMALSAARNAVCWPEAKFIALCHTCTCGVAGIIVAHSVPELEHFAYRGTAFLDFGVVAVLATIAERATLLDRLDSVALRWLGLTFALSGLRLLLFESHQGLGLIFGWAQVICWTLAMLGIAWQAIARSQFASQKQ